MQARKKRLDQDQAVSLTAIWRAVSGSFSHKSQENDKTSIVLNDRRAERRRRKVLAIGRVPDPVMGSRLVSCDQNSHGRRNVGCSRTGILQKIAPGWPILIAFLRGVGALYSGHRRIRLTSSTRSRSLTETTNDVLTRCTLPRRCANQRSARTSAAHRIFHLVL